jgi:hypothetical protein
MRQLSAGRLDARLAFLQLDGLLPRGVGQGGFADAVGDPVQRGGIR